MLNHKTVLVESTDCSDDDDDIVTYYSMPVVCLPHKPTGHPPLFYTCQLSRLRRESHACGLKTSISRRLTLAGQFLTPD